MGCMRRAPPGLGASGRALWAGTMRDFELSAPETALLTEACRTADRLAAIAEALDGAELIVSGSTGQPKSHPLLASAALQVTALDTLIHGLALPIGDESAGHRRSASARDAALARWGRNGAA
jgi:hypothetical protein